MKEDSKERLGDLLFYGVILCLAYFLFRIFEPFLEPLGWAAVFAVIFYSVNQRLARRWGSTLAASMSTAGVLVILIVPVILLAMLSVREAIEAARSVQASVAVGNFGWFGRAWAWILSRLADQGVDVDLPRLIQNAAGRYGEYMASRLGIVIRNIVVFIFELFVMLFALFYFFRDGDSILDRFRLLLPFDESMRDRMLSEAGELIVASVTTSLVIAAAQGVICGGAFAIVGIGTPIFWGVLMAFLALLPVIGAWPIWVPAAIWLFSTGHVGRGVVLIVICGAVSATIDNILRPLLLAGRASLNGLLIFISVLGGIAVFGVLGIVLGPIVVATVVGVLDVYSGKDVARKGASAWVP